MRRSEESGKIFRNIFMIEEPFSLQPKVAPVDNSLKIQKYFFETFFITADEKVGIKLDEI